MPPRRARIHIRSGFVPHRHELLSSGRMNSDRRVELRLGGAASERDREPLDDLARVSAHHVASHHPIGFAIDHQFHETVLVAPADRIFERPEARLVDVDCAITLARLGLRETHGTDTGLAENGGRHIFVVRGLWISVE